jgi:hypothetical protein
MPPSMPGASGPDLSGIVHAALGGINTQPDDDDDEDTEQEDEGQVFEDPRTTSLDKTTFFIDKGLLPKGSEIGDEVYLCAKVKSLGDKVGITPVDMYSEDQITVNGDKTKDKEPEGEPGASGAPTEYNDDH